MGETNRRITIEYPRLFSDPRSVLQLDCAPGTQSTGCVRRVISLHGHPFQVAAYGEDLFVFDLYNVGKIRHVFKKHEGEVMDVVQLDGCHVASVESNGRILTWSVGAGSLTGEWNEKKNYEGQLWLAKVNSTKFVLANESGNILVFTHERGSSLQVYRRSRGMPCSHIPSKITAIAVNHNTIATSWHNGTTELVQLESGTVKKVYRIPNGDHVISAALSDSFLVAVCNDGRVLLNWFTNGFNKDGWLKVGGYKEDLVSVLNDNLIVVAEKYDGSFNIVSLSDESCIWRYEIEEMGPMSNISVQIDGRIAVGFEKGSSCVIVTPPKHVLENVKPGTKEEARGP